MRNQLLGALGLLVSISCASAVYSQPNESVSSPTTCSSTACPIKKPQHAVPPAEESASAPVQTTQTKKSFCPEDMVEIDGDYCPNVQEICLYNVDVDGNKLNIPTSNLWSCGAYKYPTKCLSSPKNIKHMHFCMDRYELPNKKGEVPQSWLSWYDAKKICESNHKRLCTSNEWTLAAEGPNHNPLPYGDGYHRNNTMCNFDRHMPHGMDVFQAKKPDDQMATWLRTFIVPSGSKPECVSPYGVYDMAGNVDEWTLNESGQKTCDSKNWKSCNWISGLKGGHWWHVRNASRPMTTAHNPSFVWYETGGRCCNDPN